MIFSKKRQHPLRSDEQRCSKCRRALHAAQWVRYKNGKLHLRPFCCGRVFGIPVQRRLAAQLGVTETEDHAISRLNIAEDPTWPDLFADDVQHAS